MNDRVSADISVGAQIRQARLQRNITATGLAKILGVSAAAVSNWEGDRTRPRQALAERLADELGLVASKLVQAERAAPPASAARSTRDEQIKAATIIEQAITDLSASTGIDPEKIHLEVRITY